MQRLYFNFQKGDVRLAPLADCPAIEDETSFRMRTFQTT